MAANLSKSITSSDDLGTNGTNKKKEREREGNNLVKFLRAQEILYTQEM